jgi:hypothetical protein
MGVPRPVLAGLGAKTCPDEYRGLTARGLIRQLADGIRDAPSRGPTGKRRRNISSAPVFQITGKKLFLQNKFGGRRKLRLPLNTHH